MDKVDWRSVWREVVAGLTPQSIFRFTSVDVPYNGVWAASRDHFVVSDILQGNFKVTLDGSCSSIPSHGFRWPPGMLESGDLIVGGKNTSTGLPVSGLVPARFCPGWPGPPRLLEDGARHVYVFRSRLCYQPLTGLISSVWVGPWFVFTTDGAGTWCIDMRVRDVPRNIPSPVPGPGLFKLNVPTGGCVKTGLYLNLRVYLVFSDFDFGGNFIASWP